MKRVLRSHPFLPEITNLSYKVHGLRNKSKVFIPTVYHLLQINGKQCKRKGGSGGVGEKEEEVGETQTQRRKSSRKEGEESRCILETHGFSIFKNTSLSHTILKV